MSMFTAYRTHKRNVNARKRVQKSGKSYYDKLKQEKAKSDSKNVSSESEKISEKEETIPEV